MNEKSKEKLSIVRTKMLLDAPFFGILAVGLNLIEDRNLPFRTMSTNGENIKYDPDFIEKIDDKELISIFVHEIFHCIFYHQARRNERPPLNWNLAADFVVNDHVKEMGYKLSERWLYTPDFKGKTVEEVYDILQKKANEQKKQGGQEGQSDDPVQRAVDMWNSQGGEGQGSWNVGEITDAPSQDGLGSPTKNDLEYSEQEWKTKTVAAAQEAKNCGNMPGGMERYIEGLTEPKIPWKSQLWQFLNEMVKNDYSWMRPNPRYMQSGCILPGLSSIEAGTGVILMDVSGSVYEEEIRQMAGEMDEILTVIPGLKLRFMAVDTSIRADKEFTQEDVPIKLKAVGGGGTDFRPGFERLEKEFETPKFLIYFTDMCCYSFPDRHPDYPVLWAFVGRGDYSDEPPPFGTVINVDLDK